MLKINCLVAIGASTGGPNALCELFKNIPAGLNAAYFIVQHFPVGFSKTLANRLNTISALTVKEAEHGEKIKAEYAYLAPSDYHMEVGFLNNELSIIIHQEPPIKKLRPSVDVLMKSIAKIGHPKIGVILTGMGSDGAKGMLELKRSGSYNIGESAKTCVVYGMSKASYQLGAIDQEVPLNRIAEYIVQALKKY